MPSNEHEKQHLLQIVRNAVAHDKELREKFGVGEKFRFIKDRLQSLLDEIEKHVNVEKEDKDRQSRKISADEMPVYVYLYNAQGVVLNTWANLLTPKLFYEYGINRPIYAEKKYVETIIRNKSNPVQHAYLTIIIRKDAVLASEPQFDALQQPFLKLKEGALIFENLLSFTHGLQDYEFIDGEFGKK